jgi:hypothetical protein
MASEVFSSLKVDLPQAHTEQPAGGFYYKSETKKYAGLHLKSRFPDPYCGWQRPGRVGDYVSFTVMIARIKNNALKPIVTQNRTFSMPRRAVKTPPVSAPVKPPSPAPLLCKITLKIKAIDVIIKDASTHLLTGNLRV